MVRKTRAQRELSPSVSQKDETVGGMRESGDEVTQTPQSKKLKMTMSPVFISPAFEDRFKDLDMGNRAIIYGQPLASKLIPSLNQCGVMKLFSDIGLESFILDLPNFYYPDLVREYYANLQSDKFGNVTSMVRGTMIQLNPPFLSSRLKIKTYSELDIYTAQGSVNLPFLSYAEQLQLLMGDVKPLDSNPPPTTVVTPLAHLVFKLARSHLCPRVGNKSNFTCQDVVVVAMIMSGKAFDVPGFILKKMQATVEKSVSGLPYANWLSNIFKFFSVDVKGAVKVTVKDCIDQKFLALNNLQIEGDVLSRIVIPPSEGHADPTTSSAPQSANQNLVSQSLQADVTIMTSEIISLRNDTQAIRNDVKDIKADFQAIKGAMKDIISQVTSMKELMLKTVGNTSTAHSEIVHDQGLENLAKAAAKNAPGDDTDTEATKSNAEASDP